MNPNPWQRSGDGDCYRQAVNLAEKLLREFKGQPRIRVVHGLVTGTGGPAEGKRYGHAWVEINASMCADSSQGGEPVMVPVDFYYRIGSIQSKETYEYTVQEAHEAMVDHGHYGPWHFRHETSAGDSDEPHQPAPGATA